MNHWNMHRNHCAKDNEYIMSENSYRKEFFMPVNAEKVINAITKEVDQWWTIDSNQAVNVGETLIVRFGQPYFMSMEVEKIVPNKLLDWRVVGANMFVEGGGDNNDEWIGTRIQWIINEKEGGSDVVLHHEGLIPSFECYETCSNGWEYFLGSLEKYLSTGEGSPFQEVKE